MDAGRTGALRAAARGLPPLSRKRTPTAVLAQESARHIVTAVIVSHDGARWLPETLAALKGQSRPVQRVVAADTGSTDESTELLAGYLPADAVVDLPAGTGYGDAVRGALELRRSTSAVHGFDDAATEWIWLLHDDLTPERDTLERLLKAAERDPRAAVLGPKLRDWFDRRRLIEVGVTIDGAGRRETGLEQREFDHGQHDGDRRVLAVSSAGMLVRRDVWDRLGGFDPALPLFRDDIDFCWRVGGVGLHTRVVTDAVAYHAEASARRRRTITATRNHPRRIDRRHAVFVLLANLPTGGMVAALARNSAASLLRVVVSLFMKQPADALDEAAAITLVYLRPFRLIRARFRRRRDRKRTYSAIRPYLARGIFLRKATDAIGGFLAGEPVMDTPARHQAASGTDEEDEALTDWTGLVRRTLRRPGVLLVLSLTALALVAERSLLFGDLLAGGALPPVSGTAWDLWDLYLSTAPDSGLGSDGPAPPYTGFLALLSTLTLGQPWIAVGLVLLGCVPLSGLTSYLLACQVLGFRPARVWVAATYALLPVATGAVSQGRVGTALVHVLLPVAALLLMRVVSMPPRPARRSAWGLGLVLTAATAFVPIAWLLALTAAALVGAAFGHMGRRLYTDLAIGLAVPLVLLLPWTLRLLAHPTLWLLEAGLHRPGLSDPAATARQLVLFSPGGPGSPPYWVTAGLLAAALCALLLLRNRLLVAAGWALALFGLVLAVLTSRLVVEPYFGGPPAPVWPGTALSFAALMVLLCAATAVRSFVRMAAKGWLRRICAVAVALLAVTTPLSAAALWAWEGADGPLTTRDSSVIPGALAAVRSDGTRPSTLVITPGPDGGVDYVVARGREPRLGEERLVPAEATRQAMDRVVAEMAGGRGDANPQVLADFGIRYVLYPRPETGGPHDASLATTLDGTPGLMREALSDRYGLWRVDGSSGRLRVVEEGGGAEALALSGDGELAARLPEGGTGRVLALAESADGGWRAALDGVELAPAATEHGTQAWDLPPGGGTLRVWHADRVHTVWTVAQGVLLLVVAVLAAPAVRTEEETRLIESAEVPSPRVPQWKFLPRAPGRRARRGPRKRGRRRAGRAAAGEGPADPPDPGAGEEGEQP